MSSRACYARGERPASPAGWWRGRLLNLLEALLGERRQFRVQVAGSAGLLIGALRRDRLVGRLQRNAEAQPPHAGAWPQAQRGLEVADCLLVAPLTLQQRREEGSVVGA